MEDPTKDRAKRVPKWSLSDINWTWVILFSPREPQIIRSQSFRMDTPDWIGFRLKERKHKKYLPTAKSSDQECCVMFVPENRVSDYRIREVGQRFWALNRINWLHFNKVLTMWRVCGGGDRLHKQIGNFCKVVRKPTASWQMQGAPKSVNCLKYN